jgi:glycosyltransferase involved in cell wall biosynthesis
VSQSIKQKGPHYYDRLQKEAALFFTMSQNMKERILPLGFDPSKVEPLPVSVDVLGFPFSRRSIKEGEMFDIVSVGRLVEKKGFDDLLRATAILKRSTKRAFMVHIIGGGILEGTLKTLARELDILDVVRFEGPMKIQDVVKFLMRAHLFVQASKVAANGDME